MSGHAFSSAKSDDESVLSASVCERTQRVASIVSWRGRRGGAMSGHAFSSAKSDDESVLSASVASELKGSRASLAGAAGEEER